METELTQKNSISQTWHISVTFLHINITITWAGKILLNNTTLKTILSRRIILLSFLFYSQRNEVTIIINAQIAPPC